MAADQDHSGEHGAEPRIALRPDHKGRLDDTVVRGVTMFRAEVMDTDSLWMCCYLSGEPDHDRIAFWVRGKGLRYRVSEYPAGDVTYEEGSLLT